MQSEPTKYTTVTGNSHNFPLTPAANQNKPAKTGRRRRKLTWKGHNQSLNNKAAGTAVENIATSTQTADRSSESPSSEATLSDTDSSSDLSIAPTNIEQQTELQVPTTNETTFPMNEEEKTSDLESIEEKESEPTPMPELESGPELESTPAPAPAPAPEAITPAAAPSNYDKVKNFFTGIFDILNAGAAKANRAWEFVKPRIVGAGESLFGFLQGIGTLLYTGVAKLYNLVINIPTNRADAKLRAQEFKTYAYESVKAAPTTAKESVLKAYEYMPSQASITSAFAAVKSKASSLAGYSATEPQPQPGEAVNVSMKAKQKV